MSVSDTSTRVIIPPEPGLAHSRAAAAALTLGEPSLAALVVGLVWWGGGGWVGGLITLLVAVVGVVALEWRDVAEVEHARKLLRRYLPEALRRGERQ